MSSATACARRADAKASASSATPDRRRRRRARWVEWQGSAWPLTVFGILDRITDTITSGSFTFGEPPRQVGIFAPIPRRAAGPVRLLTREHDLRANATRLSRGKT